MKLVCAKFKFPENGCLLDKNNQTPLHLVMKAKHSDVSVELSRTLGCYNIDPHIRDRWDKKAEQYGRPKGDKRIPFIYQASSHPMEEFDVSSCNPQVERVRAKKKRKKCIKLKKAEEGEEEISASHLGGCSEQSLNKVQGNEESPTEVKTIASLLKQVLQLSDDYFSRTQSKACDATPKMCSLPLSASFASSSTSAMPLEEDPLHFQQCPTQSSFSTAVVRIINSLNELPWEIECTDHIFKFFKSHPYMPGIRLAAIKKIHALATGDWSGALSRFVKAEKLKLYETRLTKSATILWEVAIQFSARCSNMATNCATSFPNDANAAHVYSEVIRLWDIALSENDLFHCVQNIENSHRRGILADIDTYLVLQTSPVQNEKCGKERLPKTYRVAPPDSQGSRLIQAHQKSQNVLEKFVPAASVKEKEHNLLMFYAFSTALVNSALNMEDPRRDFPFKDWPKEHDIIHLPANDKSVLLLGRSGTGKTTCCLYRLWNHFLTYWQKCHEEGVLQYPKKPLPIMQEACVSPCYSSSRDGSVRHLSSSPGFTSWSKAASACSPASKKIHLLEHMHQVFVTKNYVLCAQMKKRFYDMAASHEVLSQHMPYEHKPLPLSLNDVNDKAFPLFLTSRQFLILLDNSLDAGQPFFPRNSDGSLAVKLRSSDYDKEDPDTLLDLEQSESESGDDDTGLANNVLGQAGAAKPSMWTWTEVTASYFVQEVWSKISHSSADKNIDPLLVWMEIKSFIKGSTAALERKNGYLARAEYENVGRKMATNFAANRHEIYQFFLLYQEYLHKKRHVYLFDECQLIHNIYQRLTHLKMGVPWSIHHFFVDEVQDFTQAELYLLMRCCRNPNGLFLAGDTAQNIMRGISFRFGDLRSLFHYVGKRSSSSKNSLGVTVPKVQELTINFRSHSGILHLASSVIDLLHEYFPSSFDRMPEDKGMFPGPQPVLLQSCQVSDLALLLQSNKRESSAIEFGAHQVIIVQNDEAKNNLPDVLKNGVTLTIFESKGLEFDDVLLYNFFCDSAVSV